MKPLVIYHSGCWDGFCAAWVARKALGDCHFVPMNYGGEVPDVEGHSRRGPGARRFRFHGRCERVYSLRSREGGINVAEIAKAHGGGGHKNAAGFRAPATGATGLFTQGQASDDDEGELTMAFASDRLAGIVRVEFGKPVAWLGLPKDQAQQFAAMVARKASELP